MNEVFDALVAVNAIQSGVNGLVEGVGREEQGNDVRANGPGGGRIEMAIEAVCVGEFLGGHRRQQGTAR